MSAVIGWDIGGAHVKAARADDGRLTAVVQIACAPHESVSSLEQALRDARATLGDAERHRVTMTAELSDAFESRARGVIAVATIAAREIGVGDVLFYAGERGFITRDDIGGSVDAIASANWRASAELAAHHRAEALFIDIGSTTTDLTPICAGRVSRHSARATPNASPMANSPMPDFRAARLRPMRRTRRSPDVGRRSSTKPSRRWPMCDACSAISPREKRTLIFRRRPTGEPRQLPLRGHGLCVSPGVTPPN